jgi:hypothetical protein
MYVARIGRDMFVDRTDSMSQQSSYDQLDRYGTHLALLNCRDSACRVLQILLQCVVYLPFQSLVYSHSGGRAHVSAFLIVVLALDRRQADPPRDHEHGDRI